MSVRGASAIDTVCVLAFVVIGRRSHDEGEAWTGSIKVAAPFLLALGAAWLAGARLRVQPNRLSFGAYVWGATIVVGMLVRHFVFGRGVALSFIVVASVFLGLTMLGWRLATLTVMRRRTMHETSR